MDDLTAALASSFQVSNRPNNPDAPHPRFTQYKAKTDRAGNQDERRRRMLEQQKKRRFDFMNHIRKLGDNDWSKDGDNEDNDDDEEESMETTSTPPRRKFNPGNRYKNQLMLSEWMVEVPPDLENEWFLVLCPVAKRCLVITSRGTTTAYSRGGHYIARHPTLLPGGNHANNKVFNGNTVLDCLYSELTRTYYVLDIMCWNGHPVYESETEFRFYWMLSKLNEHQELSEISKLNPYRFEALPHFECTSENIKTALMTPMSIELDGLLFYHKRTHYTFGATPLCVWLKGYMVPEMLRIALPQEFLDKAPQNYTSLAAHIEVVKDKKEKREAKIAEREAQMLHGGGDGSTHKKNKGKYNAKLHEGGDEDQMDTSQKKTKNKRKSGKSNQTKMDTVEAKEEGSSEVQEEGMESTEHKGTGGDEG